MEEPEDGLIITTTVIDPKTRKVISTKKVVGCGVESTDDHWCHLEKGHDGLHFEDCYTHGKVYW